MRVGFPLRYRQALWCIPALLLLSCGPNDEERPVTPPETPPLSRTAIGYGVINVSYTHAADGPAAAGLSTGYLRRGSVVKIIERRLVKNAGVTEPWVLVEEHSTQKTRGWLPAGVMDVYDNAGQAETASGTMTR
ncbi:MAG: hypothetical protein LBQ55_02190 [Treponema sp.]|jgi:hypothetical protein|nr:hypothetical protein [Treponema sp.]